MSKSSAPGSSSGVETIADVTRDLAEVKKILYSVVANQRDLTDMVISVLDLVRSMGWDDFKLKGCFNSPKYMVEEKKEKEETEVRNEKEEEKEIDKEEKEKDEKEEEKDQESQETQVRKEKKEEKEDEEEKKEEKEEKEEKKEEEENKEKKEEGQAEKVHQTLYEEVSDEIDKIVAAVCEQEKQSEKEGHPGQWFSGT